MRLPVLMLVLLSHPAFADRSMDALDQKLPKVAAEGNLPTAKPAAPPWCAAIQVAPGNDPMFIAMAIDGAQSNGWPSLLDAARKTCAYPNEPAVHHAVAVIEQSWINLTGLSEAEAAASIAARLDTARWTAARDELCKHLTISDEVVGEDRAFMTTRDVLFGCSRAPLWVERVRLPRELPDYLEQSAVEPDAIVRLAWAVEQARLGTDARGGAFEKQLVSYAIDNYDYQALSAPALAQALDTAPYRDNVYARTLAHESFARAQLGIAALRAEVADRAKDAAWKEILIDAPARGITAYLAETKPYAAEIKRSNDFEHALFGPSIKAVAGCEPALRKDLLAVIGKHKVATESEALAAFSAPVPSLLFGRLIACMAYASDVNVTKYLLSVQQHFRGGRGPRLAAYYATLEAIAKIDEDRPRFPIAPKDLREPSHGDELVDTARNMLQQREKSMKTGLGFIDDEHGTVKSVTKSAAGLVIVFQDHKHQVMGRDCVDTKHLVQITSDGRLQYEQVCHDSGLVWVHEQPEDLTIPLAFADGIAPGRELEFAVTPFHGERRIGMPKAVYADGKKTKLVNVLGFPF